MPYPSANTLYEIASDVGEPAKSIIRAAAEELVERRKSMRLDDDAAVARPRHDWHADDGAKLWWKFPITEPPYCGTPNDTNWPGYHTHFTDIKAPSKVRL